jgi:hypothetical protein
MRAPHWSVVRHVFILGFFAAAAAHCSPATSGPTAAPDASEPQTALEDAGFCEGTAKPAATRPPPGAGRLQSGATCSPSDRALFAGGDAGGACTDSSQCLGDGGPPFYGSASCVRGECTEDECYTDSDCGAGSVCVCSENVGGGNAEHFNTCLQAQCRADSDCGPGNYCLPSVGYCGGVLGFYCTTDEDTCVDPATDCPCLQGLPTSCQYAPQVGRWVCGESICQG